MKIIIEKLADDYQNDINGISHMQENLESLDEVLNKIMFFKKHTI
jgi:hypothetical protein